MGVFNLISRNGTRIIALSAGAGLLLPDLASMLRPYIGNFVVTMLIVSMLRVDFTAFVARLRRPAIALVSATWITLVVPLVVLGLVAALGGPYATPVVLTVLFLFSAPPPIVSAPAFALLMGLDGALVLTVMLCATIAMPLTAPWIASLFVAETLPISAQDLALRLALMIATGFVVAGVLRKALGGERIAKAKPLLDTVSVAIAILFAIGAMDGVGARLLEEPLFTLGAAAIAFGYMLAQVAVTYLTFRPFVGVDAVAIAYAAGNRNAGLVVAGLGVTAVDDTVWLFFALSQLPVFIFPLVLKPIGQRLTRALGNT
ncbi:MAG: sodium:proton symporter [Pseudomonadota bacterium]